jgi:hypothetical protein
MRLMQTLVGYGGFRQVEGNDRRLAMLDDLLAAAVRESAELVLLPGGYLSVGREAEVPAAVGEVRVRARRAGVAVIGGVDGPIPAEAEEDDLVRGRLLPFFGFAVGAVRPEVANTLWRQASTRNYHPEWLSADDTPGGQRIVVCGETRVGVLVCGELSNWRTRELFAAARPRLVVDAGHIGMGQGLIPGMSCWNSALDCAVAHAQHVRWGASHHFITEDGTQMSSLTDEGRYVGDEDYWIAWCLREV